MRLRVIKNAPPRAEQMLNHLLPTVLSRLHQYNNQPLVIQRMIKLILAIISRTAYLELLRENITVLEQVMSLCDHILCLNKTHHFHNKSEMVTQKDLQDVYHCEFEHLLIHETGHQCE